MHIALIIKGITIGLIVSAPLGPIGVLCVQRTLNKGFKSGFISGLGAAFADIIYAVIAGFSVTIISDFLLAYQDYFKIIGGLFLLYMAFRIFTTNPGKQIRKLRTQGNNYYKDFVTSFLLTISNPVTILAFVALFAGASIVEKQGNTFNIFVLIFSVFSGAVLWWLTLISIVSIFKNRIRLRSLLRINRFSSILIVLFAILLIVSVFTPIFPEV